MTKKPTYIDLINQFWKTQENAHLTPNDGWLYFNLLREANQQYWANPFAYATKKLTMRSGMSRQSIVRSRERLKEAGLIDFQVGERQSAAPLYTILEVAQNVTKEVDDVSQNVTKSVTKNVVKNVTLNKDNIKKEDNNNDDDDFANSLLNYSPDNDVYSGIFGKTYYDNVPPPLGTNQQFPRYETRHERERRLRMEDTARIIADLAKKNRKEPLQESNGYYM